MDAVVCLPNASPSAGCTATESLVDVRVDDDVRPTGADAETLALCRAAGYQLMANVEHGSIEIDTPAAAEAAAAGLLRVARESRASAREGGPSTAVGGSGSARAACAIKYSQTSRR